MTTICRIGKFEIFLLKILMLRQLKVEDEVC